MESDILLEQPNSDMYIIIFLIRVEYTVFRDGWLHELGSSGTISRRKCRGVALALFLYRTIAESWCLLVGPGTEVGNERIGYFYPIPWTPGETNGFPPLRARPAECQLPFTARRWTRKESYHFYHHYLSNIKQNPRDDHVIPIIRSNVCGRLMTERQSNTLCHVSPVRRTWTT